MGRVENSVSIPSSNALGQRFLLQVLHESTTLKLGSLQSAPLLEVFSARVQGAARVAKKAPFSGTVVEVLFVTGMGNRKDSKSNRGGLDDGSDADHGDRRDF